MKYLYRLLAKIISTKHFYIVKSLAYDNKRRIAVNLDYIRHKTMELCCFEIESNGVSGNIAELGVYKGDFARKMNELFPNRKLYLFDTFEGFDMRDLKGDLKNFNTQSQDFSDTSIDYVMKRMKYPGNCIVKKGYFPETAVDVKDTFSFVSIDADLYEPTLKGLDFFYPLMEKGGYIFVHDFNNKHYKGVREAIIKFCGEKRIGYIPIPDTGGSVIIVK